MLMSALRQDGDRKYIGVFRPNGRHWQSRIVVDGVMRHIGTYRTAEEAARAYDAAAAPLGRKINFPGEELVSLAPRVRVITAYSSQYKGVRHLRSGRWQARATDGFKARVIGSFDTEIEAAKAFDRASFHRGVALNFPEDYPGHSVTPRPRKERAPRKSRAKSKAETARKPAREPSRSGFAVDNLLPRGPSHIDEITKLSANRPPRAVGMDRAEEEAQIAAFLAAKGAQRFPTVCVNETHASLGLNVEAKAAEIAAARKRLKAPKKKRRFNPQVHLTAWKSHSIGEKA